MQNQHFNFIFFLLFNFLNTANTKELKLTRFENVNTSSAIIRRLEHALPLTDLSIIFTLDVDIGTPPVTFHVVPDTGQF